MCTREKPQGTETLPPDIIDVSTDLFPRRLWGVPEEVMLCFWDVVSEDDAALYSAYGTFRVLKVLSFSDL